jgi:hypothetical protein
MRIKINGKGFELLEGELGYRQIVELAFPRHHLTVVYKGGVARKPEGILRVGERVVLRDGMKIEVADTNNA